MRDIDELDIEDGPEPSNADKRRVASLAERLALAEAEVGRLTVALRRALDTYRDLAERQIPEEMAACGLSSYSLVDGKKVDVQSRFVGGKLTDEKGLAWVEANGGEALIKASLRLDLPASDLHLARELYQMLRNHPAANRFTKLMLERSVHQSTLASFVNELVENNFAPPLSDLGIIRRTTTRLSGRKLRPVDLKTFEVENQERKPVARTGNQEDNNG